MPEHPPALQPPDDHLRVRPETPGKLQDRFFGPEICGHDFGFFQIQNEKTETNTCFLIGLSDLKAQVFTVIRNYTLIGFESFEISKMR